MVCQAPFLGLLAQGDPLALLLCDSRLQRPVLEHLPAGLGESSGNRLGPWMPKREERTHEGCL